jgi:predicted nuclease of restriction endonuclease-like (RecB) superfamily
MSCRRIDSARLRATDDLLGRITPILDAARGQVVRVVNHATVSAYWHIGREVVEALQRGGERAAYGKALIERLAQQLTARYGKGFSATNLGYFRQFYLAYRDRIPHPLGGELLRSFHPNLSWSHYRALMRVADVDARHFYETEAVRANWSRRDLERQINSLYHQRLMASADKTILLQGQCQSSQALRPIDVLKDPYVLEFLDLPSSPQLHEDQLEDAIITRLRQFLLELGRGFSFIARQHRIRFADKDFYIDLVFYNYLLRCIVLVDLKIGDLTHQDIGQMDGYVRLYKQQHRQEGDNPTIGLILCSERNEAVARYSVLPSRSNEFVAIAAEKPRISELKGEGPRAFGVGEAKRPPTKASSSTSESARDPIIDSSWASSRSDLTLILGAADNVIWLHVRVARNHRDEQGAGFDLLTDRRVPSFPAAQLALVEPGFDAGRP